MTDEHIIAALKSGDESSLAAVREKYGALCRGIIKNLLSDPRDVEECENSTFMKLWSAAREIEITSLKAYTARIARNEALMRRRANAAGEATALPGDDALELFPASSCPQSETEARALGREISRFLRSRSETERDIFLCRYWLFMPVKAIAARRGLSENRVSAILFRVKKALKKHLIKEGLINE